MVVGICQLTFHLPGNRSLKGKRQIIRRMTERVRHRFHISIGEVDDLDRHQQACLGLAVVGNSTRKLQSVLDQILQTIDQMQLAPLIEKQIEFIQYERHFGLDRALHDPEAVKHGIDDMQSLGHLMDGDEDEDDEDDSHNGWRQFEDESDDYADEFDQLERAAHPKDGAQTSSSPDAPWAKGAEGAENPWAFLDEWED